jgi:UDP-glucose 4-epimerase
MKILLTGGAGFIGSHLAEKLLEEKHSVVALDDLSTGSDSNISLLKNSPDFSFIEGSILNQDLINQLVESVDGVIHLGAALGVKRILDFSLYVIYCKYSRN